MDYMEDGTTLERQIFRRAQQQRIPVYGVLELLPLCNLSCEMCYVRMSREEMEVKGRLRTIEEWIALAEQMRSAGTLFLLLTGGEPLLYPGFRELYLKLREMGMIVTLNTNGTMIDEEWAEFFGKNKPRRVNVTLYGASEQTYRDLCHYPGGFEQTMQGIRILRKYGVDVKINGSLAKGNMDDRMEILKIGDTLNVPVRIDTYMYPAVRERSCPYDRQVRMSPEEAAHARVEVLQKEMGEEIFRQYMERTLYLADHTQEGESEPGRIKCRAGKSSFAVNWQGEMRACVVLDHPSVPVFETGFETAWEKIVRGTEQICTSEKCSQCRFRKVCDTCAASAAAEEGDFRAVPEYVCRYTEQTIACLREIKRGI